MGANEIDLQALKPERQVVDAGQLDNAAPVRVWDLPDAPKGSTEGSLLVYERGEPVRVAGPSHYQHLADGRIVAAYNGGTHHSEPGPDGRDRITAITGVFEG